MPRRRRINRGALPPHLPREEIVIDVADKILRMLQAASSSGSARTPRNGSTSSRPSSG